MAFTNQFASTVELTRLLPPIKWATSKAGKAIMSRARELRQSGSDIVVEEDLASVFGRCRVSTALTSSFKTLVTRSSSNASLIESITLQGGPGPTISRAFQEPPYFAMVVQLSLLTWTFNIHYLATAIADSLRDRLDGAPSTTSLLSSPDRAGVLGVLRSCEEQTSAFNWNMMLDAVSRTLGYRGRDAPIDFPPFILQGLIDMFPMVQSLPGDRLIHIQLPVGDRLDAGSSTLVVWAHHVLDLTVLVQPRRSGGQEQRNIRFGNSEVEQIFIEEVQADEEAFITLLDSQKEHLLTIKPDPDVDNGLIGAVRRIPAKGWGNAFFLDEMAHLSSMKTRNMAILEELQLVTAAFACLIADHLIKDDSARYHEKDTVHPRSIMCCKVDEHRLLQASRFLFDNASIRQREIDSYVAQYRYKTLDDHLPRPPALEAAARSIRLEPNGKNVAHDEWNIITGHARRLSILLIAFANVVNLDQCEDLIFAGFAFNSMFQHTLAEQLEEWDGKSALAVPDDAWLQAMAIPLLGYQGGVWKLPWEKVCLISDKGWSAWLSTFGDSDPAYLNPGSIMLGRGKPCRNGVWKIGIWDSGQRVFQMMTDPRRAESCGDATSLHCAEKIIVDTPYCGEGENVFVVSARFRLPHGGQSHRTIHRVGYRELHTCLWWAQSSSPCSHRSRTTNSVSLALGCATVAGFGNDLNDTDERILIFLTAYNSGARWFALATLPWLSVLGDEEDTGGDSRQLLLRHNDTCYQCLIHQAASRPGRWYLIL
ncbi:MAG: hypothetical protein Q9222_005948 [Ikaeria aurantiellina]